MTPTDWLIEQQRFLPSSGRALDVACGRGRHAFWLATRGLRTDAVDRDPAAVAYVNAEAARRRLPVVASLCDLEDGTADFGPARYDLIVVVNYLHRPLFPALVRALGPGGVLLYETFTVAQAARGRPTNPAFLLQPGELTGLVAPLDIVAHREGEFGGRMIASVAARRR